MSADHGEFPLYFVKQTQSISLQRTSVCQLYKSRLKIFFARKGNKLIGLVHPDMEAAKSLGLTQDELLKIMEQNRRDLNAALPQYCKLAAIVLREKEFEKTPKKSIKRYLYQNAL